MAIETTTHRPRTNREPKATHVATRSVAAPHQEEAVKSVGLRCLDGGEFELRIRLHRTLDFRAVVALAEHEDRARLIEQALAAGL